VVEVLSPATEAIDRREKLFAYQSLESLREYVLISQDPRKIEVYRKERDGGRAVDILEEGDVLRLECLEAAMTMGDFYEDAG
jgi:Uma2 family endonuclease